MYYIHIDKLTATHDCTTFSLFTMSRSNIVMDKGGTDVSIKSSMKLCTHTENTPFRRLARKKTYI